MKVSAERLPCFHRIELRLPHAQFLDGYTLAVKQTEQVMVVLDQEFRRIGKTRRWISDQIWVHMPMRRNDAQFLNRRVNLKR